MQNLGEEIAGVWLQTHEHCEFVQYNLQTPDIQGEIDVLGINIAENTVYICEVAIHLVTGIHYVNAKTKQPDNVARFLRKFNKNIDYAEKNFEGYKKVYMLWSPIVKNQSPKAKHNQMRDMVEVREQLRSKRSVDLQLVINERFQDCLDDLRHHAASITKELTSPVLRYLQIEERLKKHLEKLSKQK